MWLKSLEVMFAGQENTTRLITLSFQNGSVWTFSDTIVRLSKEKSCNAIQRVKKGNKTTWSTYAAFFPQLNIDEKTPIINMHGVLELFQNSVKNKSIVTSSEVIEKLYETANNGITYFPDFTDMKLFIPLTMSSQDLVTYRSDVITDDQYTDSPSETCLELKNRIDAVTQTDSFNCNYDAPIYYERIESLLISMQRQLNSLQNIVKKKHNCCENTSLTSFQNVLFYVKNNMATRCDTSL